MTLLDHALALAEQGFHVFPLKTLAKTPAHKGWKQSATRDPDTLRKWFTTNSFNIGIFTGKFGDADRSLVVVDVDVRDGKKGDVTFQALEQDLGPLPPTYVQTTATGGKHYVFVTSRDDISGGANKLGPGVDIKAGGGCFIVGAGSITKDGVYCAG